MLYLSIALCAAGAASIAWAALLVRRATAREENDHAEHEERVRAVELDRDARLAASEHHGLLTAEAVKLLSEDHAGLRKERDHAVATLRPVAAQNEDQARVIAAQVAELTVRDVEREELSGLRQRMPELETSLGAARKAREIAERRYLEILNATDAALQDKVVTLAEAEQIASLVKEEMEALVNPLLDEALKEHEAHETEIGRKYDTALWRRALVDRAEKKLKAAGVRMPEWLAPRINEMTR